MIRKANDQNISSSDEGDNKRIRCEEKPYIILVGNPGVGKSTILNSLTNEPTAIFEAGVSWGTGLTTAIQLYETDAYFLGDTPGLSDIETREQAAREISSLLRKATYLKLIFVVTLEAGRVKPDDLTTMNLILESIDIGDTTNKFAIIVNKIPHNTYQEILRSEEIQTKLCSALTIKHKTARILILQKKNELEDARNVVTAPDPEIYKLLLSSEPVKVNEVRDINVANADEMVDSFREQIRLINEAKDAELARMKEELTRIRNADPLANLIRLVLPVFLPPPVIEAANVVIEVADKLIREIFK